MKRRDFLRTMALTASGLLVPMEALASQAQVTDVRLWTAPDHTRIVFELDRAVEHSLFRLSTPERVVIDLAHTVIRTNLDGLAMTDPVIRKMRSGHPEKGVTRIVFDLSMEVRPRSFRLQPAGGQGHRLVVDLYRKDAEEARESAPAPKPDSPARGRGDGKGVVVIDPGHGGEDPGAIGKAGTREKVIALEVGKKLADLFNHTPGYKAYLTRNGDYYVSLKRRVSIARSFEPDLFMSLHADAFRDRSARGASVYCLSERGKPSPNRAIDELVKKENEADLIGGVDLDQMEDRELATILMDLSQRESLNRALILGDHLLDSLRSVTSIKFSRVRQAGFIVLKAPDVPSTLVEMAFLTNGEEEQLLRQDNHQNRLAKALFEGSRDYLAKVNRGA